MSKLLPILFKIQKEVKNLKKDTENKFFDKSGKPTYVAFVTVLDYIHGICNEHNILLMQTVQQDALGSYLETRLVLIGEEDPKEHVSSRTQLVLDRDNMHGLGSAITYARRYSLLALFGIAQEDDDGNAASKSRDVPNFNEYKKPMQQRPQNAPQNPNDPGDFIITFGKKYNGMKLKNLAKNDCYSYIHWLTKDTSKPIDDLVKELIDAALAWYGPEVVKLEEKDVGF